MAITYKDAGVDIDAGARLVDAIAPLARSTARPEVIGGLGGFAGLCTLPAGYRSPVLVSSTDGVGTKLKTAIETGRHDTVGIDLVAMAVNDVVVTGAEPLLFLDYLGTGHLDVDVARDIVAGIAEGCRQAGCALLGGETAELPGLYQGSDYDLAGFCVGVVERDDIRDGTGIAPGDPIIGLPAEGLHSNGHSLARKVLLERFAYDDAPDELGGATIGDVLLRPTRIYVPAFAALRQAGVRFLAAAHITGGGLVENPPRLLPAAMRDELALAFDTGAWTVPPVMELIARAGVAPEEMRRTFNMGIGMILICKPEHTDRAMEVMGADLAPRIIGHVAARQGGPAVRF